MDEVDKLVWPAPNGFGLAGGDLTMQQRTYPSGVPCWVDIEQPDLDAARRFYGGLFGWTFSDAMPPGAPGSYLIAQRDSQDVAAIGPSDGTAPAWQTYIAVDDADATAAAVVAAGGTVVDPPWDAGPGGRAATCADPDGAVFRLWQPRRRPGAQRVNRPDSWNFSDLRTTDEKRARAFYSTLFGWVGDGPMLRLPGYGDHLARTVDPDIHRRQAAAPPGFADVVAGVRPAGAGEPAHWHVTFSVTDRDDSAAMAERLGGAVESTSQTPWNRVAVLRDPQGARFSISQFTPAG